MQTYPASIVFATHTSSFSKNSPTTSTTHGDRGLGVEMFCQKFHNRLTCGSKKWARPGVFTLSDARSFFGLTSKIPPLGSLLNFDADIKKMIARHQCENRFPRSKLTSLEVTWFCHVVLSRGSVTWFCHVVLSRGRVTHRSVRYRAPSSYTWPSCSGTRPAEREREV